MNMSGATVQNISKTLNNATLKSKQVAQILSCLDSMNTLSGLDEIL